MDKRILPENVSAFETEALHESINQLQTMISDKTIEEAMKSSMDFVRLMAYYKCAMMEVETKFKVINEGFSMRFDRNPISNIKCRLKNPMSIYSKAMRKGLRFPNDSIEDYISDIAGVRVICSFVDDVYMLADALIKQDDITLIEKKDYIAHPKENGYRSMHLIVAVPIFMAHEKRVMKVEIQLRTIAMDFWASLEHELRYKKGIVYDEKTANELLECAEESAKLDDKMNRLRVKMHPDGTDSLI